MLLHEKQMREVYGETLVELGQTDPRIVVAEADLMRSNGTVVFAAEMSRRVNDSNALTLGEGILAPEIAGRIVDAWLDTDFQDAPAAPDWVRDSWKEAVDDIDRLGSEV